MSLIERQYQQDYFNNAWTPDPTHAEGFAHRNPTARFCLAAPHLMDRPFREVFLPEFLTAACLEKYGPDWKYEPQAQQDGTCVGQSHKTLCDIMFGINRYLHGTKFPGRSSVAANYAGGRVDIAGQPGSWQGSNGSWSAEFLTKYGVVLLDELELPHNSRRPDELMGLRWARSRSGVPPSVEGLAKHRPFDNAQNLRKTREVDAALGNFQPVNICTSLIPSGNRNSDGVSRMSRQGGHSTFIAGVRKVNGRKVYAYFNSWGSWAKGHYGWEHRDRDNHYNSTIVDITEAQLAQVLRSGDCYTFSGPSGFEVQYEDYWQ